MSRKYIFFSLAFFLMIFAGTLVGIGSPFAAEPVGFAALFVPLLAVGLVLNYAMRNRSKLGRGLVNGFVCVAPFYLIGTAGGPFAGMLAMVLMLVALGVIRSETRSPAYGRPVAPAHRNEAAARNVVLPWNEGRRTSH